MLLKQTMVSERADVYYEHLKKAPLREKFKMCKTDVLSDELWSELQYVVEILEPLMLFLRDNDGSVRRSNGNSLGHAYYNFYKLDQFYLTSTLIKAPHRAELSKKLNERWIFGHTELQSAGFVLHPYYRLFQKDQNPDVMNDFYSILDKWVNSSNRCKVLSQLCQYKEGRGHFAREEAKNMINQPMDYWRMFGSMTPELQGLALKVFAQSMSASCCETNWSTFDYIFSKRRNLLGLKTAEKLVYIHGILRNIELCKSLHSFEEGDNDSGSSLLKYLQNKM